MAVDLHDASLPPSPEGHDAYDKCVIAIGIVVDDYEPVDDDPPLSRARIAAPVVVMVRHEILDGRPVTDGRRVDGDTVVEELVKDLRARPFRHLRAAG